MKQPNAWSLYDYQRARWALALATVDLAAACGEQRQAPPAASLGETSMSVLGFTPYPERKQPAKSETASSGPVVLRSADAFLYASDVLNVETEWADSPALLAEGVLRYALIAGGTTVAESSLPGSAPARVTTCLRLNAITPGNYELNVALVKPDGSILASASKPCQVIPARAGG